MTDALSPDDLAALKAAAERSVREGLADQYIASTVLRLLNQLAERQDTIDRLREQMSEMVHRNDRSLKR